MRPNDSPKGAAMSLKLSIKITNGDKRILLSSLTLSPLTGAFIGDRLKCRAVDVVSEGSMMVLRENFRAKVVFLIGSLALGPGLAAYFAWHYFQNPHLIEQTPWFPRIAVPLCIVFCTYLLVRTLRWQRVIVLDFTQKLAVFAAKSFRSSTHTRDLSQVTSVQVTSITRLKSEDDPANKANQILCYLLTLQLPDGPLTLFETTDGPLTHNTAREISSQLAVPLDAATPPTPPPTT